MSQEKVYLLHPAAVDWVSERMSIRPSPATLWMMYAIRRHGGAMSRSALRAFVKRCKYRIKEETMSDALNRGRLIGIFEQREHIYHLTPTGREYLSRIRQYLIHQRLDR